MAEFVMSSVISTLANRLTKILIEESRALGNAVSQAEWIEKELRSMQGLLEQVEQHGYGENAQEFNDLVEELKEIARDAEDVIETFVIKSVKRRRSGLLYWFDKYKVGKELEQIHKRMSDISHKILNLNTNLNVSVETPGEVSSLSTSAVTTAMERLDHILSQTIFSGYGVIQMVEQVHSELAQLQNIVHNLKSTSERENVWMEEVKEVCNDMKSVAGNIIIAMERRSKKGRLKKVFYHSVDYSAREYDWKFKKQVMDIRIQIGDALRRSLTYEIGGQLDKGAGDKLTTPRTTPLQHVSLVSLILGPVPSGDLVIGSYVKLWRSMDKNLRCVQRDLDLMLAFLRDAAESEQGLNERQKVWVYQLRFLAQNAHSIVDAYSKGGSSFYLCSKRIDFAHDFNYMLKEILSISERKYIYGVANIIIQGTREELHVATTTSPSIEEGRDIQRENEPPSAPAVAFYQPVTWLKEKVQSMRAGMELMDALSRDAQEMGGELDRRSKTWVDQMEGIATEAGSIINDYVTKVEHKSLIFNYISKYEAELISKKIDDIRNKIDDTWRRRKAYGLVQIQSQAVSSSMVQIQRGRTQPSLVVATTKESSIIGFEDDTQVLKAQLLSDEKRRCITWIVGIRGTGKTTLAKLIIEDKIVVDHFEVQVWVSRRDTAQQLLEEIANEAANQITHSSSYNQNVLQTLAHKRYLIVVDGIEETSHVHLLDTLKKAIPDMSTGSRLLLTIRNVNAAQHAADTITFVHPLQLLDDESSWVMFTKHLKVDIPQEELVKVGREFVMKCGGLPSQILKMSYMISHKEHVTLTHEEWSSVLNQIQDQIQTWSETLETINADLPLYLRRCLSYFGLFPAEFGIPVRRLVVLWVAESLVVHHGEQDQEPPEQVAERYLIELIDRNMVQVATRKRNGKVKTCRVPNALRKLWLTDSNDSRFLQGRRCSNDDPKNSIIRRVVDHLDKDDIWHDHIHDVATNPNSSSLKTYYKDVLSFMSFDPQEGSKPGQQIGNFIKGCISSNCFLLLRVLDLERVYKPKLPKRISRLTRLRYLGLRWTYLDSLPSSISKLLKLQTLDLKHTYIHTLPSSIWKMELRHLFLSETYRTRFPCQPKGNSLSDLQTLWGLFVDEETPMKNGLDKLVNIKKLGLACQSMSLQPGEMIKQLKAVADWITKLNELQSLRLKSRDEKGEPWILNLNSFVNHTNLSDIYLLGSLSGSNVLSQFPLSLVELTLSHSKLEDDPMKLLKDFPKLRTLCLLADSYMGYTMVCESQSFPQLRVLKFWVLEHLQEWTIKQGALPCLRQLEIRSCSCLIMPPDGLEHVNTLLELTLTNMPKNVPVDKLKILLPDCHVVQNYF